MKKVLVIGDVMLDVYVNGVVERISPEGPIPVFLRKDEPERYVAGGAANVAMNVKAAACDVSICGAIGNDESGEKIEELLRREGIDTSLLVRCNRPTTQKIRYIGQNNQQVLRIDSESKTDIKLDEVRDVVAQIENTASDYDVVVLSDYKKGLLNRDITVRIISIFKDKNVPIFIDLKDPIFEKYKGATLIKPNRKELHDLTKLPTQTREEVVKASIFLCNEADSKYVLTTLGADGMLLVDKEKELLFEKTKAKEVFDVTGAGDTTIAYLAAETANGKPIKNAIKVANAAAGIQVSKLGTSVVYRREVKRFLSNKGDINKKIIDDAKDKWLKDLEQLKKKGKVIVFTNGCFDILHAGHITYLKQAKALGDYLIIGVNSDASVKRLKGNTRPINSLEDRMLLLSALSSVDYVIPFDEDTPLNLIKEIRPSVLVKGGDYKKEEIVGADVVLDDGGRVEIIDFVENKSTTNIIEKMKESIGGK